MAPDFNICAVQSMLGWFNGSEAVLDYIGEAGTANYTYLDHATFCSK